MLRAIELRDFAIADDVVVPLGPGLNVVSGETGAGKSLVVDALVLATGGRAGAGVVRAGAAAATVQLVFDDGAALGSASRRIVPEGRNLARLDGEIVTVSELQSALDGVVGIFGQHAYRTLLDPAQQRALLDRTLDAEGAAALAAYRDAHGRVTAAEAELARRREEAGDRGRRLERLRSDLAELEAAELRPGERAELEARLATLRHAERLRAGVGRAVDALQERETAAASALAEARRSLEPLVAHAPELGPLVEEVATALNAVHAIAAELERFLDGIDASPGALDRAEARAARLDATFRRHGGDEEAALRALDGTREALARLERAAEDDDALERARASAARERDAHGGALRAARERAARALEAAVDGTLRELGLPGSAFLVALEGRADPGPHGLERVAFQLRANAGAPAAPLDAVASGGELSRVMLALNAAAGSDRRVLAFDEVDAGLGGRAGRAVASVLHRLARGRQVVVVTHLAQVAALADHHVLVEKTEVDGRTVARARAITGEARVAELARMLAGDEGEVALHHAQELLATARSAG